jgi:alanine racemase
MTTGPDAAAIDAAGAPVLTVDIGALARNWQALARRAAPAECGANVKANAYGCGIEIAGPALARAGCRTFFVAHLSEARRLRAVVPDAAIYLLHGLPARGAHLLHAIDARPVLGSAEEIAEWREAGAERPAALHVDTGMNRLGLRAEEALALARSGGLSGLNISLLMSHFVSAEIADDPMNARQIAAFATLRTAFRDTPASLANSSGLFLREPCPHDLVRPGYALYGGNPVPGRPNPMEPVVRLEAPVVVVRRVKAGETIGYNGQWTAPSDRRIAVIASGYADGIDRRASSSDTRTGGHAIAGGVLCPIVARVSMDLITVDISALPPGAVVRGDPITLIGGELDIDRVAAQLGTLGYEVLTRIAARVSRVAVGG